MTRHGAGPFASERKDFDPLSEEDHNKQGPWQGNFRSGAFDVAALNYALNVCGGVDEISMSHLDSLAKYKGTKIPVCTGYECTNGVIFW